MPAKTEQQLDNRLRALEAWLSNMFKDAEKDMRGKWDKYMERAAEREKSLLSRIKDAKTPEAKEAAENKYQEFLRNSAFKNKFKSVIASKKKAVSFT